MQLAAVLLRRRRSRVQGMQPVEPPERPRPATSLEIPDAGAPPQPASVGPEAAAESGPLGDLVAAHFRRVEVAMLARVLITTLGGALPASMVRVQRRRSRWQRLIGRPGQLIGITITAGDRMLSFQAPEIGIAEASVGHAVRGVVLSSSPVPVPRWLDELAELLNRVTREDEATRMALERALLH